ncbi:MAG: long-chain fatty acid--CoA ligase [Planctomycetes bacterium]|nr:long-chain fatty acid--CoA ligase [Planctomycetota bacterium]
MTVSLAATFASLLRRAPSAVVAWTAGGDVDRAALEAKSRGYEALLGDLPAGGRVGLSLGDAVELLAAFLALRRRDCAAILLDAADPRAPRLDLAARLGAVAVLAGPATRHLLPDAAALPARGLAAVKLTSGSTEAPRAIGVTDEALLADAAQLERSMGIGDDDRVLAAVPMSFSYGVGNLLVPALARGRCLVLPDAQSPAGLLRALRCGAPTVLPAVPALVRALANAGFAPPPSLRLVLSAGAVLAPEVARQFRERTGLPVHAFYGSTESGGICYDRDGDAAERGLVGAPVEGAAVELDEDQRVVVRSAAVGVALDGSDNPAGGRFRAADRGEWLDGELRLCGRVGLEFDVGGHKVDPADVERIIAALPGVREVAVLPWRDEQGRSSCAAVVAGDTTPVEVRRACAVCMPPAKVPRRVCVVTSLPRNARGKLERARLEELLAVAPPDAVEPAP